MAILTRPASVQKGSATVMTINRTELAALVSDPYYADANNWKEVFFQFEHPTSGQKATCLFVQGSDNGEFKVTHSARGGNWQVKQIMIKDFDKGFYQLKRDDLNGTQQAETDFFMASGAVNGDLYIGNGQTVQIAAGSDKQYGDLIIESGGVLEILPGGAITTIEVTQNCVINGTIKADNGNHGGGTWNKSAHGESLTYTVNQSAGGKGGDGFVIDNSYTERQPTSGEYYGGSGDPNGWYWWAPNEIRWNGAQITGHSGTSYSHTDGWTYHRGPVANASLGFYSVYRTRTVSNIIKATGGSTAYGNGGGGGKTHSSTPANGQAGQSLQGGNGGGGSVGGAVYGNDGADGVAGVSAGAGGARGSHGQALYLKAYKIQGGGTIDAAGNKGGDGGDGTGGGSGHPAGGGGAGGSGGKIWLRYKTGTPNLSLLVTAGERGVKGWEDTHITNGAEHGQPGTVGSTDVATY